MESIHILDRTFVPYISAEKIRTRVSEMAAAINADYEGKRPLVIGILKGALIFSADLFRELRTGAEISFCRLSSYEGLTSSGEVAAHLPLGEDITGRDVIIAEDIIDTGRTLSVFLPQLRKLQPASLKVASLLAKPAALLHDVKADYLGFEIPNSFVVGYGLDYNGLGRNLPGLYMLKDEE